jgi:anti-sigma regulatory factor (Ser/Thr protein kinase)
MDCLRKSFEIIPRDFFRAGEVSIQVQNILKSIGFRADVIRRVSVCAYEAEMNVVMHGGAGTFVLGLNENEIVLDVSDDGPGIEDIEQALQEGYSTAPPEHREIGFGAGMGLPNIKKNSDFLNIESRKGTGTRLNIRIRVGAAGG